MISERQARVLDYLRLNPGARTWKVARDVFDARRNAVGRVNVRVAAGILGGLHRATHRPMLVSRVGEGWVLTAAGQEALAAFAFEVE